jgi:probable LLM family oxidoreductase
MHRIRPLSFRYDYAMALPFELGLHSFIELTPDPATGRTMSPQQRMHDALEAIVLADEVGLDVHGVGEHHRKEYVASAPAVILAAAAARTKRIKLTSTVTVLSSDDPVRVFQQFVTLDLISNGRAEITAGRGSFIESFPLFGYDLNDYHDLFAEKLELLVALRDNARVTWSGRFRAALNDQPVFPRPAQDKLPIWVAVGGTPESVIRAGTLGLPLAVAIIGGMPEHFAPLIELYREAAVEAGHDPATLPVSINSLGFIADDTQTAANTMWPPYHAMMSKIGKERGWSPMSRQQFDWSYTPRGANFVGAPNMIIDKILAQHELFQHNRFLMQFAIGGANQRATLRAIELYGGVIAPAVRKALAVPA